MGVKWAGHEVDHLCVSSTELRMKGAIPLVLLDAFMVQTGTRLPFAFYTLLLLD